MGLFDMLTISGSALAAERQRAEVTSANLANAETTHTDAGGPMCARKLSSTHRRSHRFAPSSTGVGNSAQPPAGSVQLTQVVDDTTPPVHAL